MRPKPASSLQKTYDDCYLMCSTAVYFEGQNNEEEALKSWRSALETIYYHNAYRVPSKYTPRNETEKALQESIRQLELQCRERVDLLEALRESRKDSLGKSPPPAAFSTNNSTPGWIAGGTVPAVGYTDLSKPPSIPGRPPPPTPSSSAAPESSSSATAGDASRRPALRQRHSSSTKLSERASSPEGLKMMPSTLRSSDSKKLSKKKSSPRRKELRPAAASQAAGLAWGSIYRSSSDKTVSDAALASSRHTAAADPSFRKSPALTPRSKSGDAISRTTAAEARPSANSSSPSTPRPPAQTTRPQSAPRSPARPPPSSSSPRPSVKPKPQALRSSYPSPGASQTRGNNLDRSRTPQAKPTISHKEHDAVNHGINRLAVSGSSLDRRGPVKRTITPPSSDPESSGPRSTTEDDDDPDVDPADAEDDYMAILNKLPKGIDPTAARQILNDIVVRGDEVYWDDVAGLDGAKKALKEAVVYPFLRPDLFSGLREPARGMLLFGPPGTGKTMLARAVATESKSTFFSVSASTLTSKWHGESEKLVRALFGLAKALAPSIIFVDEIDSLLSARSSGSENEASRRSKTEFLIQWSDLQRAAAGREPARNPARGTAAGDPSRVLVLAATNMPWDIDEAARRRFVRRQYIPLPEPHVRDQQLRRLLSHQNHELSDQDIHALVQVTDGFSGSDITALAKDAAMGPLRNLGEALLHTPMDQIRPIRFQDFEASLVSIRPSVSAEGLREYEDWARQFGERGG
ncbi:vacuolar sorting protein 4b [Aspergillus terreus NIH2624]|uniref:Vacuolar sorting protein 4b n=1 Tax=Aspergillus terreus (strain NIH 2624 / FGSC A1156) TaxID=341663 RepID=Q0CSS0_ASPTN|nr:vacuolar sorting protein 4b [Aspergillus terreus NIH2624]EAU36538.1 vacuolar sorting protein 4b [Aspergillus terreus NIH2624]